MFYKSLTSQHYIVMISFLAKCADAGFTSCCTDSNCEMSTESHPVTCFCDATCYKYNDCCSDIADIGCLPNTGESCTEVSSV